MKLERILFGLAAAALVLAVQAAPASAQATRTWVSGVGDDANPCSRTAPCKTFAGAISKTATAGEISVLDPGGFGGVTITKSISIVAASDEGGILAASANGVIINGANIVVYLKGLIIEGAVSGLNGIRYLQGAQVTIEDCVIRGFGAAAPNGNAIFFVSSTADSRLNIIDTTIETSRVGIFVNASGSPTFNTAFFDNVTLNQNVNQVGVEVNGAGASLTVLGSTIQGAINKVNNGKVFSFGNNVLFTGTATQTLPLN